MEDWEGSGRDGCEKSEEVEESEGRVHCCGCE